MRFPSFSFALFLVWSSSPLLTSAWITPNPANNRRTIHVLDAESHFLPADVISRTGLPVSGITYSNYDSNPTATKSPSSPNNSQTTPADPFTARGELIDPSASLTRDDTVISPPVPTTPRVVPTTIVTRGHPADEVGVRRWREAITPPVSYASFTPLPSSATMIPDPVVGAESFLSIAESIESSSREVSPEKAAFQQAEMSRWAEAARRDEQKKLERQAEKESFKKEEMARWTEAAKRDAHSKKSKKSGKAKSSRKKKSSSSRNGKSDDTE